MTPLTEGDDGPTVARGPRRACAFLPSPRLRAAGLPAELTGERRRRLLRDIEAAIDALNWMRGSACRPIPRRISAATERSNLVLQVDVRQRAVQAAARWSDVNSAGSERGFLARHLQGRSGHAPSPPCSVGSYEYSKASLPGDLRDAPAFAREPACVLGACSVAEPPGVSLLSGEGLAGGLPLHLGVGDAAGCFRGVRLTKTSGGDVRRYFRRPPLAARHAGIGELDGVGLGPGEKVWLMCASLPQAGRCACVDNASALSFDGGLARQALGEAQRNFDHDALRCHVVAALARLGLLGWHLGGDSRDARPGIRRIGLTRQGARGLLRLRQAAGCRSRGDARPRRLLLVALIGAMVFVEADCEQPWTLRVYASEASLRGFGMSQPLWEVEDAAAAGRLPELNRHLLGGTRGAGIEVDPESGEAERGVAGRPARLDRKAREILEAARWKRIGVFPEVPSGLLTRDCWRAILADRWPHPDDILRLEARAVVKALLDCLGGQADDRGGPGSSSRPGAGAGPERSLAGALGGGDPEGPAGRRAREGAEAAGAKESDDSSDREERAAAAARRRTPGQRGKGRVRQALAALMDGGPLSARQAPLEARVLELEPTSALGDPGQLDAARVAFANREFDAGAVPGVTIALAVFPAAGARRGVDLGGGGLRGKAGESDDSTPLGSRRFSWMDSVYRRRAGASADRAEGLRAQGQVMRRGRWQAKSARRCE
ncbi:unnamed protein product [Prorocentrum cordatum]|uniref:Uncharacterized protein n=1 Tax=Prorocentrum cordatum TaxID=2364126 RepID=A0ABN9S8L3_9DINO|nr:unnamed protein product [Polarella glacialis]